MRWCYFQWPCVPAQGHDIVQREIIWKWYKIELYLLDEYSLSNGAIFNDRERGLFPAHTITRRSIYQKRYKIHCYNGRLIATYAVLIGVILNDFQWPWVTTKFRTSSSARHYSNSWTSCGKNMYTPKTSSFIWTRTGIVNCRYILAVHPYTRLQHVIYAVFFSCSCSSCYCSSSSPSSPAIVLSAVR